MKPCCAVLCLLLTACSFDTSGHPHPDAGPPDPPIDAPIDAPVDAEPVIPPDAAPPIVENVAHVPAEGWKGGTASLELADGDVIDTSALTITDSTGTVKDMPTGIEFITSSQTSGDGPELAVLRVSDFSVVQNATVRVIGSRPLVVIAESEAHLEGTLDAAGTTITDGDGNQVLEPGAGGYSAVDGPGTGQPGVANNLSDPGGGGAGHATAGADGGRVCTNTTCDTPIPGGTAGMLYGEARVPVLQGGSPGGSGSPTTCSPPGGEAGGAIQIYAAVSITVGMNGGINAGGGGGVGGMWCNTTQGSGAGGGSGGVIYLQAPTIDHQGILAANGGGGGSSAGKMDVPGANGGNGGLSTTPATGGNTVGKFGGNGGAKANEPTAGMEGQSAGDNGGGGGGAVGYIVLSTATAAGLTNSGQSSPTAYTTTYPPPP